MNETNPAVTEADLHAYADGQLPEAARARVEAYLAENPDEAAMVAGWRTQNAGIKNLFAGHHPRRYRRRPDKSGALGSSIAVIRLVPSMQHP